MAKKHVEAVAEPPPPPPPDPWTCATCGAPELDRGVRVGSVTHCVTCFYELPGASKGRFVSRVRPKV